MKKTLFTALFAFLAYNSQAQTPFSPNNAGGAGHFQIGYTTFDASDVAQKLMLNQARVNPTTKSYAFPEPEAGLLTIGGDGYGVFNSIMIGAEAHGLLGSKKSNPDSDTTLSTRALGAEGLINLGYVAYRNNGLLIYPMVGVGYGAFATIMTDDRNVNLMHRIYPDYVPVGERNENAAIINSNVAFNFALGGEYFMGSSTKERAKGFSLGFRIGYRMQMANDNFMVNDGEINPNATNMPEKYGVGGPYFRLLIGGGSVGAKK